MFKRIYSEAFSTDVIHRVNQYIDVGLWKGIEKSKFTRWCGQFTSHNERVMLALILESLVYRSTDHLKALIEHSLYKTLPQALYNKSHNEKYFQIFEDLCRPNNRSKEVAIIPVIRESDPPTKSGPLVARLYKRLGCVSERNMYWPWARDKIANKKVIVFIDDFLGTGNQFNKFFDNYIKCNYSEDDYFFVYCPLTASEIGVKNLERSNGNLIVSPVEIVTENENFFRFSEIRHQLRDDEVKLLNKTYDNFIMKVGLSKLGGSEKPLVRGYEGLALTYAYEHATPNASLPLLWANSKSFFSLFTR